MNNSQSFPRFSILIARLGLIVLLAGCGVDQKKEIATYRAVYDSSKQRPAAIEPGAVLTLTQALQLANQNEERLSIQGETYLQALIAKDQAFAAFLPTINISPSYSTASVGNNSFGRSTSGYDVPVAGEINLFNGFRDYHQLKADKATIEQQKQVLLDLQQTVLLDVATTYYQILTSEQSVEVLTDSIKVQQARVDNISAQARVGTARPLDVAQAQAQLSQTQVSLNQSRADVQNGRTTLAFLLDAPVEESPLLDDYDPPAQMPTLAQLEARAEAARQDLAAQNAALKAARENVEVAFGQYYPSLALNLDYTLYSQAAGGGAWSSLFSLNLPIFTGGLIEADVRQAWSLFRQAALTQAQLRRSIDEAVETANTNLDLAHRQLAELQIEVEAARQALFLADQTYKAGSGTILDVLVAQNALLTTQLQLTTEQYQQKTAYFNVLRSVGDLKLDMGGSPAATERARRLRELATRPSTMPY